MGWLLKIKKTKKETKYRIWTTNSDGYITDWSTREEIVKFLFWHRFNKFMENVLEDAMTFPGGYTDKDTGKRICLKEDSPENDFNQFMVDSYKVEGKNSIEVIADKFREIITKSGIEVSVKDSDGYNFK